MKIINGEISKKGLDRELRKSLTEALSRFDLNLNDIVKILDIIGVDTKECFITFNSECNSYLILNVRSNSEKMMIVIDKDILDIESFTDDELKTYVVSKNENDEFSLICVCTERLKSKDECF